MTLTEFNALNKEEQAAMAIQGNFVDVRFEGAYKVAIYRHPYFLAEVFYDGTGNCIVSCRAVNFNLN